MKLFLTSSGLSNTNKIDFLALLDKDSRGLRVAFVTTAMNPEPEEVRQKYISMDAKDLEDFGMMTEFIDLEEIDEKVIVETFKSFDIVYVYGGNTFYLMHFANKSGFTKHIREILQNKVYFGVSAGSIIVGPEISLAGWPGGDPNDIALSDMRGLALVPFSILPHWNGVVPPEVDGYPFEIKYIKDGEAVSINNEGMTTHFNEHRDFLSELTTNRINVLDRIQKVFTPISVEAHLLGSVARGDADALSDIDVWCTFEDGQFDDFLKRRFELFAKVGIVLHICEPHQNAPLGGLFSTVLYQTPNGLLVVDYYFCPRSTAFVTTESKHLFGDSELPTGVLALNTKTATVTRDYRIDFFICFLFGAIKKLVRKNERPLEQLFREYDALIEKYEFPLAQLENRKHSFETFFNICEHLKQVANENQKDVIAVIKDFGVEVAC